MFESVQEYSRVCNGIQECPRVFKGVQDGSTLQHASATNGLFFKVGVYIIAFNWCCQKRKWKVQGGLVEHRGKKKKNGPKGIETRKWIIITFIDIWSFVIV